MRKSPAKRPLAGLAPLLLLLLALAPALPAQELPAVRWTPSALGITSLARGESATFPVVLANSGTRSIPLARQLEILVEGSVAPYVSVRPPAFPTALNPGDQVTIEVDVAVPLDAATDAYDGALLLTRRYRDSTVQVWRGAALPVSVQVGIPVTGTPLNDTGIDWCADGARNYLPCPVAGFPGQDGESGRDLLEVDRDGFRFVKLDAAGNPLAPEAMAWHCVRDEVTGRVWEIKGADGGLRDAAWTYSWYRPDPTVNGGDAGYQGYGACGGGILLCDTDAFVQAVNAQGLCGAHDWRIPTVDELLSIIANDRYGPAVDTAFFPDSVPTWYWSSTPYPYGPGGAWLVHFGHGYVYGDSKAAAAHVRLVRGRR